MDDLLADAEAGVASGLKTLSGRSFFVVGDAEARWLERKFLARAAQSSEEGVAPDEEGPALAAIVRGEGQVYSVADLVKANPRLVGSRGTLGNESILHGLVIEEIKRQHSTVVQPPAPLYLLDVHHEISASPVKPAEYQDRIDVLARAGSSELKQAGRGIPSFYDLYEVKKGILAADEVVSTCNQLMKYVDFVAHTAGGGNYDPIRATIVARGFEGDFESRLTEIARRGYIALSRAGLRNRTWLEFRLVAYEWRGALALSDVLTLKSPSSDD
jgi:hypothetical protein